MEKTGFYHDGIWNSVVEKHGKKYRHRVEIIVFRDRSIYAAIRSNGEVRFPGGSTEKDVSDKVQVLNELHEEAFIDAVNIQFMATRTREFGSSLKKPKWMANLPFQYDGYIDDVYCGIYNGDFNGHVDECDKDETIANGDFVAIDTIFPKLDKFYHLIITKYLSQNEKNLTRFIM